MRRKNKKLSALGIFLILAAVVSFIVFYLSVLLANPSYHYVDTDTMELVQTQEIPEGAGTVIITTSLGEGNRVVLRNFGTFAIKEVKAKVGRNPKDPAKDVPIPPRKVVKFKVGKTLKEAAAKSKN